VTGPDGTVVRAASSLRVGDAIVVRLAAGEVGAAVTGVHPPDGEADA
jgi:hypothetical protein